MIPRLRHFVELPVALCGIDAVRLWHFVERMIPRLWHFVEFDVSHLWHFVELPVALCGISRVHLWHFVEKMIPRLWHFVELRPFACGTLWRKIQKCRPRHSSDPLYDDDHQSFSFLL